MWVGYLLGVMLCAYFLAKMTTTLIADRMIVERKFTLTQSTATTSAAAKPLASFDQYKVVMDRNIFDSKVVAVSTNPETLPTEAPNLEGPGVKTSVGIKLFSPFSVGSGGDQRSTATILGSGGGKGGSSDVYTVGDEKQFAPGVKITKILPDRVEFINGPRLEYVELENLAIVGVTTGGPLSKVDAAKVPPTAGVAKQSEGKFAVDQAEIDNAMKNLDKLFTEVRAVPNFVGGKPAGIKLLSMTPTSLFAKLGLQRGDVIERINGVELDMKRGFDIFNQLKGEK